MKIKNILITGDDGYNSIGTRLLVHFLKDKYDLKIAATKDQQSGMGGKINLEGGAWGETEIDGVQALWVDGSPVDALECAQAFFKQPFDLTISGINLGANISGSIITSGTFAAANRAFYLKISRYSLAISLYCAQEFWLKKHDIKDDLTDFLEYPGSAAYRVIELAFKKDFWGAEFLNINLPKEKTNKIKFTKFLPDIKEFYRYPTILDKNNHRFSYPHGYALKKNQNLIYDTAAIDAGYISITPCLKNPLNEDAFEKMKHEKIRLILKN